MFLGGCGAQSQYRNYTMPALFNPSAPLSNAPAEPARLSLEDSILFEGGIRVVRADRAIPVPEFSLLDERGRVHTPASLLGRVMWMDLWANWCATCRAEFPDVQRIHEELDGEGLTILAVCRNSTRKGFEGAVRKDWISFPVVDASADPAFPIPYGAFPTNMIVDRSGRVRAYWQGHRPLESVENLIRTLLAEPPTEPASAPLRRWAAAFPGPLESKSVVSAELDLPREDLEPGALVEGKIVLQLAPGWYLTAGREEGSIPVEVQFEPGSEVFSFGCLLPRPERLTVAGAVRDVYSGRVELPLWGVVRPDAAASWPAEIRVMATVQACDTTSCLVPSEIVLSGEVCLADPRR